MPATLVQVPATTSNCGPGFDTLSVALSLYNFIRVEPAESGEVEWIGEGDVPGPTLYMAEEASVAFAKAAGVPVPGLRFEVWGDVPQTRGLGSSATIRCGLLAALNERHGRPLSTRDLIGIASRLDHAPDGVASAFLGGFCISRTDPASGAYRDSIRFDVDPGLAFVVVSPAIPVFTTLARQILPAEIPFRDAVRTVNSVSWLVAALAKGDPELLRGAISDYLHQPYREKLTPFVREAIEAGRTAGAYDGWLSGSGSSVVCVSPADKAFAVGQAMSQLYFRNGIENRVFNLRAEPRGLTVGPDTE